MRLAVPSLQYITATHAILRQPLSLSTADYPQLPVTLSTRSFTIYTHSTQNASFMLTNYN